MSEQAKTEPVDQVVYERCPCQEIAGAVREILGISPAARQHFANARVESLKAVRAVIDQRIENLSAQQQASKGTKVAVE